MALKIDGILYHNYNLPLDLVKEVWLNKETQIIAGDIDPRALKSLDKKRLLESFIYPAKKILQDAAIQDQNYYTEYLNYKVGLEIHRFLMKCYMLDTLGDNKSFDNPVFLYHRDENKAFSREKNSLIIPGGNRIDIANLLDWPFLRCLMTVNNEDYATIPWTLKDGVKYSYDEFFSLYPDLTFLLFDDVVVPFRDVEKDFTQAFTDFTQKIWKKIQDMRWRSNLFECKGNIKTADIRTVTTFPKIQQNDDASVKRTALILMSLFCENDYIFKKYKTFTLHKDDHPESWRKILKKISKVPYAY